MPEAPCLENARFAASLLGVATGHKSITHQISMLQQYILMYIGQVYTHIVPRPSLLVIVDRHSKHTFSLLQQSVNRSAGECSITQLVLKEDNTNQRVECSSEVTGHFKNRRLVKKEHFKLFCRDNVT